jgi:hypothetical protein
MLSTDIRRDAFADRELADAIRANLTQTLSRFGEHIAEMASRSLGDATLTANDAARILKAAAVLAEARKKAFASAGLRLSDFVSAKQARPRSIDRRHPALLAYCAFVVDANVVSSKAQAAERLHDRVRAFLEKRGQWPIVDASELEAHAKPAAHMLAAWNDAEAN